MISGLLISLFQIQSNANIVVDFYLTILYQMNEKMCACVAAVRVMPFRFDSSFNHLYIRLIAMSQLNY